MTIGAEVGAALGDFCFLNWMTTIGAGVAGLLINLEMVLEIPSAIDPINTGTFLIDRFC